MPKIVDIQGNEGNFSFSGVGLERLGATEYTLVAVAVDTSGSVDAFKDELEGVLQAIKQACLKSPRAENLLLRIAEFGEGVQELVGFTPFAEADLPELNPRGMTPLYDGIYDALAAVGGYGKALADADFLVNGIVIIITDGWENGSREATVRFIKEKLRELRTNDEVLESLRVILVGVNAKEAEDELRELAKILGLDQFVNIAEANAGKLAKLAAFVSQSVVAQSQALGSGGPSAPVSLTL